MRSTDVQDVEVTVNYFGHFRKLTGKTTETIHIRSSFKDGIADLRRYLKEKYAINRGYYAVVNDVDIIRYLKMEEDLCFSETDQIKIIPVISGG